jgi:hypothetical protein
MSPRLRPDHDLSPAPDRQLNYEIFGHDQLERRITTARNETLRQKRVKWCTNWAAGELVVFRSKLYSQEVLHCCVFSIDTALTWSSHMKRLCHKMPMLLALFCATVMAVPASADEPVLLIGTIVKWRYPDAEIGDSEASDAATIDGDGKRTAPSSLLKTTMTTRDSVDKVLAFYRDLLTRNPENDSKLGIGPQVGRSVVFSDESDGRPFAFHTIVINTANTSTTLVITRGIDEEQTRITWKQYLKHEVGG